MQRAEARRGRSACHVGIVFVVAMICLLTCGETRAEPVGDLVASWSFDEEEGRLVSDGSGRCNHAIVTGGMLVRGVRGAGLQFDGETTSASAPSSPSLSPTRAITVEAWIKLHDVLSSGFPTIVRKEGAYALRFSEGRLGFLVWIDGEPAGLGCRKTDWSADRWHHFVATYDGSRMRLFVDGSEDAASSRNISGPIDSTGTVVGIGSSGSQHLFRGVIDEVRIFSRALSASEIRSSYAAGRDSLFAQKDVPFQARQIGAGQSEFRKPAREVTEVEPGFLWVDAEDFADYGGWWLDTQFVHLMGSAYLIAAGVGRPVQDAVTELDIPRDGTYRVWVRAKNWLEDYSPGQFTVAVDGVTSKHVFGAADTDEWIWQSAGGFHLERGRARIALHDLTGYYGRCDALVLTTDLSYMPPEDTEAIRRERARLAGLSLEPEPGGEFDVIVVGAGAAGSCAAIASARLGAKTALIQNRPVLGGNASIELGVPICGAGSGHPNARESGIIEEAGRIKARFGFPKMSHPFRILAEGEEYLSVFLNKHVFAVEMQSDMVIDAVRAVDTLTGSVTTYRGKLFLDCTGDGWVGYFAGAEYRLGRESRDEFNESLAPERPDKITMSGCLMGRRALSFRAERAGGPIEYVPPPWAAKLPGPDDFGRRPRGCTGGEWWLEHAGHIDDLWDAEKARDELIRISYGYWDYLKNQWPERDKESSYELTYVPIIDAKRESRRLVGDYILTQNDVQNPVEFPDRISYGGWSLDVHHPNGVFSGKEGPFDFNPPVPIYTIPFRCLYSKNIHNLLFAGRDISVTHVALGTVRVQGTLATLGQAAGTAAALCLELETPPRGLAAAHIAKLQQTLLKHDQTIPGVFNEDPDDLARTARVTASSTAAYEPFGRKKVQLSREIHPLNMPRAVMFPRGINERLESIALVLASENDGPTPVTLHLLGSAASEDFSSTETILTVSAVVPPKRETYVDFPLGVTIKAPLVWLCAEPAEGISWRLMESAPMGSCRAYGGTRTRPWHVVAGQYYTFATNPPLAIRADYRPENAVNGRTRITDEATNLWASDPGQGMPQWVEVGFPSATRVNTVYLTFDTDMNAKWHTAAIVPQCVRDYEISCFDGTAWTTVVTEKGNYQRHRVHRFSAVAATKLRLTVLATNGDASARVFEIRVYDEAG
jgi:hypothetical protein